MGVTLAAKLNAASVLVVFRAMQIFTALRYRLPMPVQPLKAMAALVIAQGISGSVLHGAGGMHGLQEGRQFNAYYDDYVYVPLYTFVANLPLWAPLRTADHGAAHGVVAALEKMVRSLRKRCPQARLMIRGDSGFFGDELMSWREARREVYYCVGLAKNSVLIEEIQPALAEARARRVIGKAEVSAPGDNPRFLVTSLPAAGFPGDEDATRFSPQRLYEEL